MYISEEQQKRNHEDNVKKNEEINSWEKYIVWGNHHACVKLHIVMNYVT